MDKVIVEWEGNPMDGMRKTVGEDRLQIRKIEWMRYYR